jgi:hypothetical protein
MCSRIISARSATYLTQPEIFPVSFISVADSFDLVIVVPLVGPILAVASSTRSHPPPSL